jgi:hypothetical protein
VCVQQQQGESRADLIGSKIDLPPGPLYTFLFCFTNLNIPNAPAKKKN